MYNVNVQGQRRTKQTKISSLQSHLLSCKKPLGWSLTILFSACGWRPLAGLERRAHVWTSKVTNHTRPQEPRTEIQVQLLFWNTSLFWSPTVWAFSVNQADKDKLAPPLALTWTQRSVLFHWRQRSGENNIWTFTPNALLTVLKALRVINGVPLIKTKRTVSPPKNMFKQIVRIHLFENRVSDAAPSLSLLSPDSSSANCFLLWFDYFILLVNNRTTRWLLGVVECLSLSGFEGHLFKLVSLFMLLSLSSAQARYIPETKAAKQKKSTDNLVVLDNTVVKLRWKKSTVLQTTTH